MISIQDAYIKIQKMYPNCKLKKALEFENFYGFYMIPITIKEGQKYFTGSYIDIINKNNGKHDFYDIASNPNALLQAKEIKIQTIFDVELKDIKVGDKNVNIK